MLFLLELGVTAWVLLGLAVVSFFGSAFKYRTIDSNRIGLSFVWFFAAVVFVVVAFFPFIKGWGETQLATSDWTSLAVTAVKYAGFWFAAGLVTAFFYWISFVRDIRARYDANLEKIVGLYPNAARAVQKALALGLNTDRYSRNSVPNVFLDPDYESPFGGNLDEPVGEQENVKDARLERVNQQFNAVIPPRVNQFKAEVTYAATVWPVTLVSLIFADLIRHVVDYLLKIWHKFLDKVSRLAWGAPVN